MKRSRTWKCLGCPRRIASPFFGSCDVCSRPVRGPEWTALAMLFVLFVLVASRIGGG